MQHASVPRPHPSSQQAADTIDLELQGQLLTCPLLDREPADGQPHPFSILTYWQPTPALVPPPASFPSNKLHLSLVSLTASLFPLTRQYKPAAGYTLLTARPCPAYRGCRTCCAGRRGRSGAARHCLSLPPSARHQKHTGSPAHGCACSTTPAGTGNCNMGSRSVQTERFRQQSSCPCKQGTACTVCGVGEMSLARP